MRLRSCGCLSMLLVVCGAVANDPAAAASEPAASATFPPQKPGLWEITTTTGKRPRPHTLRTCMDAAQLRQFNDANQHMEHCTGAGLRHLGGDRYAYDGTCPMGANGHVRVHIDMQYSPVHVRNAIHSTYDPPAYGMRESDTVVEGRWVGASCAGAGSAFGPGGRGGL